MKDLQGRKHLTVTEDTEVGRCCIRDEHVPPLYLVSGSTLALKNEAKKS